MDAGGRIEAAARYLLERRAGAARERAFFDYSPARLELAASAGGVL